ncbi:DUF4157 domain-containing protein [Roseateles sp.]|jgi:hypothetical protein|uniref:eCIS core domain-containing protein n=1 Tax=Roseateles sp. TaxID=1971397 RepID=UPI003919B3B3
MKTRIDAATAHDNQPLEPVSRLGTRQVRAATGPRQQQQHQQIAQLQHSVLDTNRTGLPDSLKNGIEALSGMDMSGVRVHRNSSKPAALQAHAYAQGQDIHLGPGQDKHLPHEAWHVVQQAQGRVRPTLDVAGTAVNDNAQLEHEADRMGSRALQMKSVSAAPSRPLPAGGAAPVQRFTDAEHYRISEGSRYAVPKAGGNKNQLYVHERLGGTPPSPDRFFVKSGTDGPWSIYTPKARFDAEVPDGPGTTFKGQNDCGFYAGALATNTTDWSSGHGMGALKDTGTGKAVGGSQTRDQDLTDLGHGSDPGLGEAYFIWPNPKTRDEDRNYTKAAHHVATVVATDGGDRITSEADCGDDRKAPLFGIYGTKEPSQTFLTRNAWYFSSTGQTDARVGKLSTQPHPITKGSALTSAPSDSSGSFVIDLGIEEPVRDDSRKGGGGGGLSLGGVWSGLSSTFSSFWGGKSGSGGGGNDGDSLV